MTVYTDIQLYGSALVTSFILTSTWILVAMAVLRYIRLCHSLRALTLDGLTVARVLYSGVFVGAIVINLPTFWQFQVSEDGDCLSAHLDVSRPHQTDRHAHTRTHAQSHAHKHTHTHTRAQTHTVAGNFEWGAG